MIARVLAACFGALVLAARGAQPAAATTGGPLLYSSPTFDTSAPKFGPERLTADRPALRTW